MTEDEVRTAVRAMLAVMDRLAEFYIGPGAKFPMRDMPTGVVSRVTIEKIYGMGPWREDTQG